MWQDDTIYKLLLKQVYLNPDNIAMIDTNDYAVSYANLLSKIDDVSEILLYNGLSSKNIVAIALTPSVQFISTMFACLKLGIAYIPLNITYPLSYIKQILNDAGIITLISRVGLLENIEDYNFINLDDDIHTKSYKPARPSEIISSKNTAYIIYTSGSTGQPKGVIMSHENLISLIKATQPLYKIDNNDVAVLFHSLGFDLSIWEICYTLINGARLVIVPEKIKQSVEDYCRFLIDKQVSILTVTPSMWYLLQDILIKKFSNEENQIKLRYVVSAGEALHPIKMQKWFTSLLSKYIDIYNMYGITEGTIHSTYRKITQQDTLNNISPIGIPLANVEIILIDEHDKLVSDVGELCLSGLAVTSGYLNHPELNDESFFTKSFQEKEKKYFKTNDLVRKLSNGELEYIERKNKVIKIKGFRINCHEIENCLARHDFIENAIVTTFSGSDNVERLVAYLQGNAQFIDLANIKRDLQEKLPHFMYPSKFIVIKQFPLTINGKIDFNALNDFQQYHHYDMHSETTSQEANLEVLIKQVWQKVLGIEELELEDNFFDVGGDSLLLPSLQFSLQESLNINIELINLVEFSNIKQFADFIRNNAKNCDVKSDDK